MLGVQVSRRSCDDEKFRVSWIFDLGSHRKLEPVLAALLLLIPVLKTWKLQMVDRSFLFGA